MRGKSLALLAGLLILCGPTFAAANGTPSAPWAMSDVLVWTPSPFVVTSGPGYALRFRPDGVASYDGRLAGRDGHYESPVDFKSVERVVGDAKLCERNGVSTFVEAPASSSGEPHVLIQVQCAGQTKLYNDDVAPDIAAVARALLKVARHVEWRYRGPARRQMVLRFAR